MAGMAYVCGMSGETAYPVRKALGFTAGQWERVRSFRFEHRFATEAEAVRRLLDLGMRAVAEGLLPAHEDREDEDQPIGAKIAFATRRRACRYGGVVAR